MRWTYFTHKNKSRVEYVDGWCRWVDGSVRTVLPSHPVFSKNVTQVRVQRDGFASSILFPVVRHSRPAVQLWRLPNQSPVIWKRWERESAVTVPSCLKTFIRSSVHPFLIRCKTKKRHFCVRTFSAQWNILNIPLKFSVGAGLPVED